MVKGKINRGRHRPSGWRPLHPDQQVPTSIISPRQDTSTIYPQENAANDTLVIGRTGEDMDQC